MENNHSRSSFSNDISWRDAVDDFLLHVRAIREEGTEKFYRDRLKHLVKFAEANGVTVRGFHARHLRQYLASRIGEILALRLVSPYPTRCSTPSSKPTRRCSAF